MTAYEYGRIAKLDENLRAAGLPEETIAEIMRGGEGVRKTADPRVKADWLGEAMLRMDKRLEPGVRHAVREACACCLGGKRQELVKAIAKRGGTLEERVRAANETPFVFGHSVTLEGDGRILVRFAPDDTIENRCVCLPKASLPISPTYCYCCGGHIKHHLQIALDRRLSVAVRSSALSSGGKRPCSFYFTLLDD
jgi:hypothetical protein